METANDPPTVYVVAGPNGAGKTTFSTEFLPDFVTCREFLNADLIAAGLSPFAPEKQNMRAGRLLLERISELVAERVDFGFETTLSGRCYLKLLKGCKANGYRVMLFFLWLPAVELAIVRVQNRVEQGGHNIPIEDIKRRYTTGIRNFFHLYEPILDDWWIYNASKLPPQLIASRTQLPTTLELQSLFSQIKAHAEVPYGTN
ncbi:MAG TPA: zeta toxin family protein [Schlesneria sp.]|jgi:predicted ABC-type ATPase